MVFYQKAFLLTAVVLAMASVSNAELAFTVNGLDVTNPLEINGEEDLIIAVVEKNEAKAQDISVTTDGGKLEQLTEPNTLAEEPTSVKYLFNFTDEISAVTVSLAADNELIYQLVLFPVPEEDRTIVFGIDAEALAASLSQPQQKISVSEVVENKPNEPNEPNLPSESKEPNIPDSLFKPRKEPPPLLLHCPDGNFRPHQLGDFDIYSINMSKYLSSRMPETELPGTTKKRIDAALKAVKEFKEFIKNNPGASTSAVEAASGVTELSGPLYNCQLPGGIYYIPNPPLEILGTVVFTEPNKTTIISAEILPPDAFPAISIHDGGNIDTLGNGDTSGPAEPIVIAGESGYAFFNNYAGLWFERSAGTQSRLDNIFLMGFYCGILLDQQLDFTLSRIYTFGVYHGFISFGPNSIVNSYVHFFGMWTPDWQYYGFAYTFYPFSKDESITFESTEFNIGNCLANDGDLGFNVFGLPPGQGPYFYSINCAATNCYSGFNGWDGWIAMSIICPGLYNNVYDGNVEHMPFTDPVYEQNDPFVWSDDWRIFLNPDSAFVDGGSGPPMFPGWTTDINGIPDEGTCDIWPQYPTNYYVDNSLSADLNSDKAVDFNDLAEFADQWLIVDPNSADLNNDQIVNFLDFSILASEWQEKQMAIELIDIGTNTIIEPNNISGFLGINLKNIPPSAQTVYVYLDNVPIGDWARGLSYKGELISFESSFFLNGYHTIRIMSIDLDGNVTNYEPTDVYFSNLLYKVIADDHFHHSWDYCYSGFYDGDESLDVKLTDIQGQEIWSTSCTGNAINLVIPGSIFLNKHICEITIEENTGAMPEGMTRGVGSGDCKKRIQEKFVKEDFSAKAVFLLPSPDIITNAVLDLLSTMISAYESKSIKCGFVYHHDNTEENWRYIFKELQNRKDIIYVGHANSHIGRDEESGEQGVQRTNLVTYKKKPGWLWDKYSKVPAVSHTRYSADDEDDDTPLPLDLDNLAFDLRDLKLKDKDDIRIGFFRGCRTAGYEDDSSRICCPDLAKTFGFFSTMAASNQRSQFFGFRVLIEGREGLPAIFSFVDSGLKIIWGELGGEPGKNKNMAQALDSIYTANINIQFALYGEDRDYDFNCNGDDNFFSYGPTPLFLIKLAEW